MHRWQWEPLLPSKAPSGIVPLMRLLSVLQPISLSTARAQAEHHVFTRFPSPATLGVEHQLEAAVLTLSGSSIVCPASEVCHSEFQAVESGFGMILRGRFLASTRSAVAGESRTNGSAKNFLLTARRGTDLKLIQEAPDQRPSAENVLEPFPKALGCGEQEIPEPPLIPLEKPITGISGQLCDEKPQQGGPKGARKNRRSAEGLFCAKVRESPSLPCNLSLKTATRCGELPDWASSGVVHFKRGRSKRV